MFGFKYEFEQRQLFSPLVDSKAKLITAAFSSDPLTTKEFFSSDHFEASCADEYDAIGFAMIKESILPANIVLECVRGKVHSADVEMSIEKIRRSTQELDVNYTRTRIMILLGVFEHN